MANIAAADVTYTVKNLRKLGNSKTHNRVQLVFGNGVLTYGAGGVPVTKAKLGCPNVIESMTVVAKTVSGYNFMYNQATGNLVMYQTGAAVATQEAEPSTIAIAAQTIEVEVIGW